jgi:hypothetical protein
LDIACLQHLFASYIYIKLFNVPTSLLALVLYWTKYTPPNVLSNKSSPTASAPDNVQHQSHIWSGLINGLYSCIYVVLESNRELNVFQQPKQISLAVNILAIHFIAASSLTYLTLT